MRFEHVMVTIAMVAILVGCPEEGMSDDDMAMPDDDSVVDDDSGGDDDSASTVDVDGDGWGEDQDCDDGDPSTYPGAEELCDGKDNDCDGELPWVERDNDGDGVMACQDDCDDNEPAVGPGFEEVCDGLDNDCDTTTGADHHCNPRYTDTADAILYGNEIWDDFGYRLSFAGDVNDDGYDDIVVGAPQDDLHNWGPGYVALYYGPVYGEVWYTQADAVVLGEDETGGVGWALAGAGDTNGDGYDDIVLGSPGTLFLGPLGGAYDINDADAEFGSLGDCLGAAGLGDVDGDGLDDFLLGTGGSRVYLFHGPQLGQVDAGSATAVFEGETPTDYAGYSVASGGYVNADDEIDILIGAPRDESLGMFTGAAFLVYGPFSGEYDLGQDRAKFFGEHGNAQAGTSVSSAGDTNGDGFDDVVIGSPNTYDGGTAYLFLGPIPEGNYGLLEADAIIRGTEMWYEVGNSVARAGDMNGDGLEDLLISAAGGDSSQTGGACVFHGPLSDEMTADDADFRILGGWSVGDTVAGRGDADGDGLFDLVVGHTAGDDVFVFYGATL